LRQTSIIFPASIESTNNNLSPQKSPALNKSAEKNFGGY
jgi:hypothetical protein